MTRWGMVGCQIALSSHDAGQLVVSSVGLTADCRHLVDDHAGEFEVGVVFVPHLVDASATAPMPRRPSAAGSTTITAMVSGDQATASSGCPALAGNRSTRRRSRPATCVQGLAQLLRLADLVGLQVRRRRDDVDLGSPVRRAGWPSHHPRLPITSAVEAGHRPDRCPRTQVLDPCGSRSTTSTSWPAAGGRGGQPERDGRLADATLLVQQHCNAAHRAIVAHRATAGDTCYLGGCRTLGRRPGRVASNVNSLGSGALP